MSTFDYDITYKDVEKKEQKILDKLFQDDMISIFFNKKHNLLSMKDGDTKLLKALGSKDTQKGVIIKKITHNNEGSTFSITVQKDYLEGGEKDAKFILDNNNILSETSVDGVLFFGDARVKRVN